MGPIHSFAPTLSSRLGSERSRRDGHSRTHGTAARSRELDEGVEREDEESGDAERGDRDVHLGLGLERESPLAARGASLVLGPLAEGAVVDVAAALADPELAVDGGELRVGLFTLFSSRRGGDEGVIVGQRARRRSWFAFACRENRSDSSIRRGDAVLADAGLGVFSPWQRCRRSSCPSHAPSRRWRREPWGARGEPEHRGGEPGHVRQRTTSNRVTISVAAGGG